MKAHFYAYSDRGSTVYQPLARRLILSLFTCSALFAADWRPIAAEELAQKTPLVERNADAEVLLWEVRVFDEMRNRVAVMTRQEYLRIKIFNQRGRDRWSTVNLPIRPPAHIVSLLARTIQPDGSVIEVNRNSIFEQVLDKTGSGAQPLKHKTFTFPAAEPGSILEYQWSEETENRDRQYTAYHRLSFQMDIPIQVVRYYIKPYSSPNFPYDMFLQDYHCEHGPAQKEINGFWSYTLKNVPAFKAEPHMPPDNEIRAWSLVYYRSTTAPSLQDFWKDFGKKIYNYYKPRMKVTNAVKEQAAEITAKGTTADEKMLLLVNFCRTKIKNSLSEAVSAEEREDLQVNKTPEDTLNQGAGKPSEIRELFGALAAAAGFEARMAALPRRSEIFFNPNFADSYFLRDREVAVNIDGNWRFYDPVTTGIPPNMLVWWHEGVQALISDPKDPVFVTTPVSKPKQSVAHREGHFRLSEDGTLEGDVVMQYSGFPGADWKQVSQRRSEAQREEALKNILKRYASTGEFTQITVENMDETEKPFTYRCHVRIPGYAQRTGKRLIFAPSFFQQGVPAMFPLPERKNPIYFRWPWTDEDSVSFEMPPGFEPESPQIPAPVPLGALGGYSAKARIVDKKQFLFDRKLTVGESGTILLIDPKFYGVLKAATDKIAQNDEQTITLKVASSGTN